MRNLNLEQISSKNNETSKNIISFEEIEEMERWSKSRSIHLVFIFALLIPVGMSIIIFKAIDLIL